MTKLACLEEKIRALYESKSESRADWADWLFETHVFRVAEEAKQLAEKYNADIEISTAAAMLHDIADAVMARTEPNHEAESLAIAEQLLKECAFGETGIEQILTDILPHHSCRPGALPKTLEGKVMAGADALVHLESDFYEEAEKKIIAEGRSVPEFKTWMQEKIDRDFTAKIFFPEEQERVRARYEELTRHVAAL